LNRRDMACGIALAALGSFGCLQSMDLGVGSAAAPGPGFLIFWSSVVLLLLSVALAIRAVFQSGGGGIVEVWKGCDWSRALWALLALFGFAILINKIGFLLCSFGFMLFAFILGRVRPLSALMFAVLSAAGSYALFHGLLRVSFPRGILGW
jgi:putative tricarboxylic transport membrane protein